MIEFTSLPPPRLARRSGTKRVVRPMLKRLQRKKPTQPIYQFLESSIIAICLTSDVMRILVNPPPCFMSQIAYTGNTVKIRACATSKRNAKLLSMAPSQACGEIIYTDIEKTEHNNPLLLAICASCIHRSNITSYDNNICGLVVFWGIDDNAWAMESSLYNTTRRTLIRVMSGHRVSIGSC